MAGSDPVHEVCVPCDCGDVEQCQAELYISDIRIMARQFQANLEEFREKLRAMQTRAV